MSFPLTKNNPDYLTDTIMGKILPQSMYFGKAFCINHESSKVFLNVLFYYKITLKE